MADAAAELNPSCCARSPVVSEGYETKGKYQDIAGFKTYVTGSTDSKKAVITVYDVFGMAPQTQQGADRLASQTSCLVLVPDYFKGEPLDPNIYPPDTDEKKAVAGKFMREKGDFGKGAENTLTIQKEAASKFPSVEKWGAFGLCWGGKVTALLSQPGTVFVAAGTAHPGRLVTSEAESMVIPYICLFSKEDGTPEQTADYTKALEGNKSAKDNVVEKYSDMHHGWMGARADLKDESNKKEYERGYDAVSEFFKRHL